MAKTAQGRSTNGPGQPIVDQATEPISTQPTTQEIAERAYYIYLERGLAEGNPTDDWLQAERELIAGR